jgi:hypothetical protein
MLFVIKNRKEFTDNTEIYEIKTRQQKKLHQPLANLKKYQKGIHYLGLKLYNNLPSYMRGDPKITGTDLLRMRAF